MQTSDAVVTLQPWPHDPQLFGSSAMSISQPVDARWSQSWNPVVHEATAQVDAVQDSTALAVLHAPVQLPQWAGSLVRLTHAAFAPPPGGQRVGVAA